MPAQRKVKDEKGQQFTLGKLVGSGGQAEVYAVSGYGNLVAKIYRGSSPTNHRSKIAWMIDHPPEVSNPSHGSSIAWPTSLLLDDLGELTGILLPRVRDGLILTNAYNPWLRSQKLPMWDRERLLKVARCLAELVESMHHAGYVIGDLNESNILVSKSGHVTLIDTDSCQVRALHNGKVTTYRAPVGKPEYTAPEIQGVVFETVDRMFEHDRFALAVLLFQLLMEGQHPYSVKWLGAGDPPTIQKAIQQGLYPYSRPSTAIVPPPYAPEISELENDASVLFERSFGLTTASYHNRPSGKEWAITLDAAITSNSARSTKPKPVKPSTATPTPPKIPRRTSGVAPSPFDVQLAATSKSSQTSPSAGTPVPTVTPITSPSVSIPPPPPPAPKQSHTARSRKSPWLWVIGCITVLVIALNMRSQAQPVPRIAPTTAVRNAAPTRTPLPATKAVVAPPTSTATSKVPSPTPMSPTATSGVPEVPANAPLIDDDFSIADPEENKNSPDFKAYVADGVMNLEILSPGSAVWYVYPDATISGDFSFTVTVEAYRGHGEVLVYIVEPGTDQIWAFAVDPVAKTWALDRESDYGKGLFYWITPRKWETSPNSFSTITVQRKDKVIGLLIDGERISSSGQAPLPAFADQLHFGVGATINPENRFGSGQSFAVSIDRVTLTKTKPD